MRDRLEALGSLGPVIPAAEPWAFTINQSARCDDIEITLLSFTLVEEFARLTGLVRLSAPTDVRLASVPALSITGPEGPQLVPVSAHVLPQGALAWVSWLFRGPAAGTLAYEARIERVDLAYQIGKRPTQAFDGPWVFRFELLPVLDAASAALTEGSAVRA